MKNITFDKVIRFMIFAAIAVLIAMLMWRFSLYLAYLLVALVLSYMLDPLVNRMQSNGMHRTLAIVIVMISVILLIIWASTTIIPNVGNQIARLASQFNIETITYIAQEVEDYTIQAIPYLPAGWLVDNIGTLFNQFFDMNDIQKLVSDLVGVFTNVFAALIIIPFSLFFFLKDGGKLRRGILQLVPNKYFETVITIISKIEKKLSYHFRGVALQSTLVATLSWIFLSIAGLNNALSVGIAIGVANTIPYFGPILGYILSIVIAIIETGDFTLVLNCILAVAVVQIIDNVVFYPTIFSRTSEIHPLYVLLIILIGAELAGLIGMLLAIPIASTLRVIITQIAWSVKNYHVFKSDP